MFEKEEYWYFIGILENDYFVVLGNSRENVFGKVKS